MVVTIRRGVLADHAAEAAHVSDQLPRLLFHDASAECRHAVGPSIHDCGKNLLGPAAVAPAVVHQRGPDRAATVRVVKVANVTDYDALFGHVKAFTEVKAVLDRVAQRLVDAGETVPGVTVEERRDVA